jgi:hypothetical protein
MGVRIIFICMGHNEQIIRDTFQHGMYLEFHVGFPIPFQDFPIHGMELEISKAYIPKSKYVI